MTGHRGWEARTRPPFVTALSRGVSLCLKVHEEVGQFGEIFKGRMTKSLRAAEKEKRGEVAA